LKSLGLLFSDSLGGLGNQPPKEHECHEILTPKLSSLTIWLALQKKSKRTNFFEMSAKSVKEESEEVKDSTDALVLWAKIQKNLREMEKKRLELINRRSTLESQYPFLLQIDLEDKVGVKSGGAESSEAPELVRERHKKRNLKLKAKRKEKLVDKKKEKAVGVELKAAETSLEKIELVSEPVEKGNKFTEAAAALFSEEVGRERKIPKVEQRASHFKVTKSPTKEGGVAPSESSNLLHVDGAHRANNSGNPVEITE